MTGFTGTVASFTSSKVAHYTGKISPKSKVQCPKSETDLGHWTLDFGLILSESAARRPVLRRPPGDNSVRCRRERLQSASPRRGVPESGLRRAGLRRAF